MFCLFVSVFDLFEPQLLFFSINDMRTVMGLLGRVCEMMHHVNSLEQPDAQ